MGKFAGKVDGIIGKLEAVMLDSCIWRQSLETNIYSYLDIE
jgi:hypothetical protein